MKRSRTIISTVSVLAAIILAAALYLLPRLNDSASLSEELHPSIEAHTSGCISVSAPILVTLSEKATLLGKHSNGDLGEDGIFSISPSIKGRAIWLDNYTIEFRPHEPLSFGQRYNVEVNMTKLVEISNTPRKYRFEVYTIKPNFSASVEDLSMYDGQKNCYSLTGHITTDDSFSAEKVEKMLKINNRNLPVTWSHENRNMHHSFVIDSIKSEDNAEMMQIEVDGKIMGSSKTEKFEIEIPEKDAFRLLNVSVEYEPEFRVVATFSNAIAKGQRLGDYFDLTSSPQMRFMSLVNKVYIYPVARLIGDYELTIVQGLKSRNNKSLEENYTRAVVFEDLTPNVEFIKGGTILPSTSSMKIPFRSVNYKEVEVRVTRIFSNNILQFLQENDLDGNMEIYRVGKVIAKKRIVLGDSLSSDIKNPKVYQLDVGQLIGSDKNAIYKVSIDGVEDNSDYDDEYWWVPSNQQINIFMSDLGITAKYDKLNNVSVYVANLLTTSPESGADVEIFDFTNQCVGRGKTDSKGMCNVKVTDKPHTVIVTSRGTKGYLRMAQGNNLSVSRFDVEGQNVQGELKGYIFGERGVWRPGDQMFMTFMLCDKSQSLPENHPIKIKLFDPQGQLVSEQSATLGNDGICTFTLQSDTEAPTGTYTTRVELGNNSFEKNLRIETIKPNRLKIKLDMAPVVTSEFAGAIHAEWLHGAKASGMTAKIETELTTLFTPFAEYKEYHFQDDSKDFDSQAFEFVSAQLNSEGKLRFRTTLDDIEQAPGMLNAKITTRIFEPSGNFSTDVFNVKCAPFKRFVGIKFQNQESETYLETKRKHQFDLVMLDYNGKPTGNGEVEVEILKMEWEWWWNIGSRSQAYFMQNSIDRSILTQKVELKNGKGKFEYQWEDNDWGLYTIRVRDLEGGHSTSKLFRVDWADTPHSTGDTDEAMLLTISTDKERYKAGESAKISFPSAKGAKALVTVESTSGVIESRWIDCQDNTTTTEVLTTENMVPNVYVWVSLIQPYDRLKNDAPLRLYGIVPLVVDDITTQLEPQVKAPAEVRPEQSYTVEVSEKQGKAMSYTLAIVDEGLLDLTRFRTPDPWSSLYAREALNVRTWDMYNDVIGAYGGSIEQLFSVGGDNEIISRGDIKAQRFTPVVKFLGPFELQPNQKAQHAITLPNYIGAVRTMVVAAHKGRAFGSAETRSFVRKPLMTLMTMPRTVATDDVVEIPVTVFAMQDNVGSVNVELTDINGFKILGESSKKITFAKEGEQIVIFKVKASATPRYGSVKVKCTSSDDTATDRVEINIQDANIKSRVRRMDVILPNSQLEYTFPLAGRKGTNTLTMSLSTMLAVDISGRLSELTDYPHGCLEQIVSGAFPQLYLTKVTDLNETALKQTQDNISAVLNKLLKYRLIDGSLSYWPGENKVNKWASVWAGHFMVEARNIGYATPAGVYECWLDYEKSEAKMWRAQNGAQETQAYRLWVLAQAGEADRGAMNRLRENTSLSPLSKRLLAGAYAADGRKDLSRTLLESAQQMTQTTSDSDCFGSVERDMAIESIIYKSIGNQAQAYKMAKQLGEVLSSNRWLSTQTTAWALMAVAQIVEPSEDDSSLDVEYIIANKSDKLISTSPIEKIEVDVKNLEGQTKVHINNNNSHTIYLTMESMGIPARGSESEAMNNLKVQTDYLDGNGKKIDISQLKLGQDFVARVTITPTSSTLKYDNMALTQLFPSGWEIRSNRGKQNDDRVEYQDVRDDRIMVYFNLQDMRPLVIETRLSATYAGEFYLPGIVVESMYNGDISARTKGKSTSVKR